MDANFFINIAKDVIITLSFAGSLAAATIIVKWIFSWRWVEELNTAFMDYWTKLVTKMDSGEQLNAGEKIVAAGLPAITNGRQNIICAIILGVAVIIGMRT